MMDIHSASEQAEFQTLLENVYLYERLYNLVVIVCAATLFVLLLRLVSFLLNHPFLKPCTVPSLKAPQVMIYISVLKSIYRSSNETYPALCAMLNLLYGYCKIFEKDRIFRFYLGFTPVVVFFKPETVEVILSSATTTEKSFLYKMLQSWLGSGLITSSGNIWREHRKLLTSSFHFGILQNFIPIFNEQSNILVSKLKTLSAEPWVDIVPLMNACTLDIICETAMGIHIGAQSGGYADYVQAHENVGDIFFYRIMRPWLYPDVIFNNTSLGKKYNGHVRELNELTKTVIKEKKANMLASEFKNLNAVEEAQTCGNPQIKRKRLAFLELLLEHHLKNTSFTEEDIREEVNTFMFAGQDTTAMLMSWTLYFLGLDEDVQKKVHDELDGIFQNDNERNITREDLSKMKYLECVIKETLRVFPPVSAIARDVKESFKVLNHTIHKGTVCLILPIALHQNAESFKDPEKFVPERFLPESSIDRHPYAYVPFSAGLRNCIGQKYAILEAKSVLANILRLFRVESLDARDKVNIVLNIVIKSAQPLRLRFISRT